MTKNKFTAGISLAAAAATFFAGATLAFPAVAAEPATGTQSTEIAVSQQASAGVIASVRFDGPGAASKTVSLLTSYPAGTQIYSGASHGDGAYAKGVNINGTNDGLTVSIDGSVANNAVTPVAVTIEDGSTGAKTTGTVMVTVGTVTLGSITGAVTVEIGKDNSNIPDGLSKVFVGKKTIDYFTFRPFASQPAAHGVALTGHGGGISVTLPEGIEPGVYEVQLSADVFNPATHDHETLPGTILVTVKAPTVVEPEDPDPDPVDPNPVDPDNPGGGTDTEDPDTPSGGDSDKDPGEGSDVSTPSAGIDTTGPQSGSDSGSATGVSDSAAKKAKAASADAASGTAGSGSLAQTGSAVAAVAGLSALLLAPGIALALTRRRNA